MYLLYLDESIDKNNKIVTVGSVILPSSKYRKFNEEFNKFLLKKFNVDEDTEIKGDYIWNGRYFFKGKSMNERSKISRIIASFLGQSTLTKFIVAHSYFNGKNRDAIYLSLVEKIIKYSAKIVSTKPKSGRQLLLVFDERQDINKRIYNLCAQKRKDIVKKYKKSCVFIDNGYEGNSEFSRLLQVADFVGYFIRNEKVTQKDDTLFIGKADDRKIKVMEQIKKSLQKKLVVITN